MTDVMTLGAKKGFAFILKPLEFVRSVDRKCGFGIPQKNCTLNAERRISSQIALG